MRRLPRLFFLRAIITLAFFAFTAWSSQAQSAAQIPPEWNKALDTLAEKIAATAKPARTFSLDVRNISSLNAGDVTGLRQTLVEDLTGLGFSMTQKLPGEAQLQLTLSESAEDYVWVAEIRHGEAREVVIVSAVRDLVEKAGARKASLTLQRKLVWEQDERILDFALVPDGNAAGASILVVLQPDKIAFYDHRAEAWHLNREIAIPHARPVQRNVGGRIDPQAGTATLVDGVCAGDFQRPETVTCKSVPSAPGADLAMMQGSIVESDAALASTCSGSPLMLSTGSGDWTVRDFIQAYEDKNQREAIAQPIQFPGPILALWPAEDGKTARVVSRNLQTGAYEASIVSVSCGD
jgi:hypothetical protein